MNLLPKIFRRDVYQRRRSLERRLHRRALLYWESIRDGREFAFVNKFDPTVVEDYSAHGFMLELSDTQGPVVCHIGPVLRDEASVAILPVALADVSSKSLVGQFAGSWKEVLSQRKPVTAEYDFSTESYRIFCRGVLLPLSSDGEALDRVYGVITWKSEKLPACG